MNKVYKFEVRSRPKTLTPNFLSRGQNSIEIIQKEPWTTKRGAQIHQIGHTKKKKQYDHAM
jgi:hypothetical protein